MNALPVTIRWAADPLGPLSMPGCGCLENAGPVSAELEDCDNP